MTTVKLRGVKRVRARLADGTSVEYHSIQGVPGSRFWKTGDSPVGSPEYVAAYQAAKHPPRSGSTFGDVLTDYLDSNEYRRLAPRTKADYRLWADRIRAKFGDAPIAAFERPQIRGVAMKWRDNWTGKQAAYAWTVLRRVVSWAYDRGKITQHHLRGGGGIYESDRADIIWTEPEVETVEEGAPEHIWKALRLAVETGLRPGDLVRLSKAHVIGRRFQIRTEKKKRIASIPITPKAAEIIESAPGLMLLTDRDGKAWEPKRLAHAVTYWRDRLGLRKELRFYDARGAACTRLVLAGATLPEVATIMAWSVPTAARMIEVYAALDPALTEGVLVKLAQLRGNATGTDFGK